METPPLEELIKKAIRSGIARVHTQVPGRILEYDHSTQRAKVQLIVEHSFADPETGERTYYKPAPLVNVPIKFPAILTWPIAEGDPGWVEFAERSTAEYLDTGRDDTKPTDPRRFDLSDAVFYPTDIRGGAEAADGAVVLRVEDEIRIGDASTSEFLARADRVETRLQAIENYVNGHEHNYIAPAIPASAAPTTGRIPASITPTTAAGDTASDKVKGD